MKFVLSLYASFVCTLSVGRLASAANSFAGSNLYYAAGLSPSDRKTLLQGSEDAGMKCDESVRPGWLACDALDIVAIHTYGIGDFDTSKIQGVVSQSQAAGKKLIFQEWGACYFTTENNNSPTGDALDTATRNKNLQTWARQITAAGMPWMYWQVIPNADPHFGSDFEIGVDVDPSWDTLKQASLAALDAPAAFDYSGFLL